MKKHFVTFLSPGTIVAETTTKEIDSWDVDRAIKMVSDIKERHGATPYGFYFTTRERGPEDFNSKQTAESHMYYLGGKVLTLDDVKARNDPKDSTLISNMENNKIERVLQNDNSWRYTAELGKDDVVLDYEATP